MKPGSDENDLRKTLFSRPTPFPVIEWNYQTFSRNRYRGGPSGSSHPSFRNISREYFQREARRHFFGELGFFLILSAILAMTFISGARAIIHFLSLPAG